MTKFYSLCKFFFLFCFLLNIVRKTFIFYILVPSEEGGYSLSPLLVKIANNYVRFQKLWGSDPHALKVVGVRTPTTPTVVTPMVLGENCPYWVGIVRLG